jgi:hypothetical protein
MTSEDPSMTKSVTVQIAPGELQILKALRDASSIATA